MSYRYSCDHCGEKFELDTPQAVECPSCFWTSSVKRDDGVLSEKKVTPDASHGQSPALVRKSFSFPGRLLVKGLFFILLLGGVTLLVVKIYPLVRTSVSSRWEKGISIRPEKEDPKSQASKTVPAEAVFSAQEKEILDREVTVPADRAPDAGEEQVLRRVASFQTGWTEKLPSAVWSLEQYQKLIADQEAFYKMPFARSYKKKLEELFKTKYLPAGEAFAKGDILTARDLWVESLAFPLYSTDLKKHRAVALTMLRPFINDTLSKVSAMNQSLAEREKKGREQALSVSYQALAGLIAQKKWTEASASIDAMLREVEALRKDAGPQPVPPQYPPAFGTIDADLQRPLMDLMTPSPSSVTDLQPLQQDLMEKKAVLETFSEAYVASAIAQYRSALELIHGAKWEEAVQALGAIQGPAVLCEDAVQKVAILGKMIPQPQEATGVQTQP